MNIIERAKNILLTPAQEWEVIAKETTTLSELLNMYVVPLAAIPAVASLVAGFVMRGGMSLRFIITTAIVTYASAVIAFVITVYVVDFLANNFKSEKNLNKSAQLVAYSATASWVAGILAIVPMIGGLASLAGGIYAIYLMYLGIGPMKGTPVDQRIVYVIIVCVVLVGVAIALASVLGMFLVAGFAASGL